MKTSELIEYLTVCLNDHGDLPVGIVSEDDRFAVIYPVGVEPTFVDDCDTEEKDNPEVNTIGLRVIENDGPAPKGNPDYLDLILTALR